MKADVIYDVVYEHIGARSTFMHGSKRERHFITPEFVAGLVVEAIVIFFLHFGFKLEETKNHKKFLSEVNSKLDTLNESEFNSKKADIANDISRLLEKQNLPGEVSKETAELIIQDLEKHLFNR